MIKKTEKKEKKQKEEKKKPLILLSHTELAIYTLIAGGDKPLTDEQIKARSMSAKELVAASNDTLNLKSIYKKLDNMVRKGALLKEERSVAIFPNSTTEYRRVFYKINPDVRVG